ncbi:MAG: acyl-CoA thioesterase [Candidatus Obscuribacter sp.]|nr:acyl-CoA thioesterase [Candidatus Obscuribacter sp.]MBP7578492.1 acyl-CoA thioesterase [Candidatus Obscuribacter sp.]
MSAEPGSLRGTVCDTDKSAYRYWTEVQLRYGDTDKQGHINNAVYCSLFESGRVDFLFKADGSHFAGDGLNFVIAKITLDYLKEMNFPGTACIGSKILSIGRSSFRIGQAIFMDDTCYSTAESVIVLTDDKTRRSTPLTEPLLAVLRNL